MVKNSNLFYELQRIIAPPNNFVAKKLTYHL